MFHINRLNQKLFSVIINTSKTIMGGWEVPTVFWQCFASINIAEKKFLVQYLYVKRHSLISLYIAHNLVSNCHIIKPNLCICFLQPVENFNEWRLIYFISFLLLVGFFVLNMFVGVVVENFHRCRAEQEKEERARRAAKRAKKIEERRRSKNIWHHFHFLFWFQHTYALMF